MGRDATLEPHCRLCKLERFQAAAWQDIVVAPLFGDHRTERTDPTTSSNSLSRVSLCWALTTAAAMGGCGPPQQLPSRAEPPSFEFALIGDNPYPERRVPGFEALIDDVNAHADLAWVLHLGDIKGGDELCSDSLMEARFELFQRFAPAFILTPGDNDWFDCPTGDAGAGHEYERLTFLRRLFYPDPGQTTGGQRFAVESQSQDPGYGEFVENAMWVRGGVVFATFHLVALLRPPTEPATAERRMDAALAWIEKAFRLAQQLDSPAVFLATQVDPWLVSGNPDLVRELCAACVQPEAGVERLYPVMEAETVRFGRSVVLAVGDTHVFRVDKPLYSSDTGRLVENFTRVEVFGDPSIHWVRVAVEPNRPEVFSFHQELVQFNLPAGRRDEDQR